MTIGAACHRVKSQLATKYLALKLPFVDEVRIRLGLEYIVRHSRCEIKFRIMEISDRGHVLKLQTPMHGVVVWSRKTVAI